LLVGLVPSLTTILSLPASAERSVKLTIAPDTKIEVSRSRQALAGAVIDHDAAADRQ
jgi:hypothetical protein